MKKGLIFSICAAAAACLTLTACGSGYSGMYYESILDGDGENYVHEDIIENGFTDVADENSSYFSLDRNTATYSMVRSQILNGEQISPTSVRVEEMINYFDYSFPAPQTEAVAVSTYLADCPWNSENKILMAGVKTASEEISATNGNYVFLIDVSGSMSGDNRLPLAQKSIKLLVDNLGDGDCVSLVTYASGVELKLSGVECTASGKQRIKSAIDSLTAYGSTNGEGGLTLAYDAAKNHFITGGNNRVILISDGDFNVGINDTDRLTEFIQNKAATGVYLSVIGVGMGNMRDDMLETLATCGNGNYAYLDSIYEAEKVFIHDLNGTMKTVAKDAKAGVTFTSQVVKYRLIGYDTKLITEEEFENDNADAGEIGSGLSVVAMYELQLAANANGELATAQVKYKDVRGETQVNASVSAVVTSETQSSKDLEFASCVAEFGLILRQSAYKGHASFANLKTRLAALSDYIADDEYKVQFVSLVEKAQQNRYDRPVYY